MAEPVSRTDTTSIRTACQKVFAQEPRLLAVVLLGKRGPE